MENKQNSTNKIKIGNQLVGEGEPVFVIAEIGLNHNGDLELAKKMINIAAEAGCDAVKFQKRDPELCVPIDQRKKMRETPWGYISYMEYRYKVEFDKKDYDIIDKECKNVNIQWTASCWDENSLEFIDQYNIPFHKVPSALLTNISFHEKLLETKIPIIFSTGMSTMEEIDQCIRLYSNTKSDYALLHCTSTYPCPLNELNLKMIDTLKSRYNVPVGYSGHEPGLVPTLAAVALGASIVERHITLDRSMWGSDQASSIEPGGLKRLVNGIRDIEIALGDGKKVVYDSEIPILKKLRI